VARRITAQLEIPTFGIGAGAGCDGQVLVYHDLLGLSEGHLPRFVKRYANLSAEIKDALSSYAEEVRSGAFPDDEHSYSMDEEELAEFEATLESRTPSGSSTLAHASRSYLTLIPAVLYGVESKPFGSGGCERKFVAHA